jgi:hypothetical protein
VVTGSCKGVDYGGCIGLMWLVIRYSSVLCVDWIDVVCGQVQQCVVCGLD